MRFYIFPFFLLPSLLLSSLSSAQQVTLDCPDDESLTSYLLALIDTLYNNGLTIFEQLIADASETDTGYNILVAWFESTNTLTLVPPTDSAFQAAGLNPPFTNWNERDLANLLAMHVFNGSWSYSNLPQSPLHAVATTQLLVSAELGVNETSNSTIPQGEVAVLVQGNNGQAIIIDQLNSNATSWNTPVNMSLSGITNLVVLPIDTVLSLPSNLSVALQAPTTSQSANGLTNLTSALSSLSGGIASLEVLEQGGGFTIFAPVDDAFSSTIDSVITANSSALGNFYTTSKTIYSWEWVNPVTGIYTMDSGASLNVTWDNSSLTHFVTLGDVTATILRADIPLANGVMHIVDQVLIPSITTTSAANTPTTLAQTSASQTPGTSYTGSTTTDTSSTSNPSGNAGSTTKNQSTSAGARSTYPTILAVIAPVFVYLAVSL